MSDELKRLDTETRWAIVALNKHTELKRYQIAKKLNVARSTVTETLQRYEETGDVADRPRSGRPSTALSNDNIENENSDHNISINNNSNNPISHAIQHNNFTAPSIRNFISHYYHNTISLSTINKLRHRFGFHSVKAQSRPKLTETHQAKRLKFAEEHVDESWHGMIFTDEAWFQLDDNRGVVWKRPHDPTPMLQVSKYPDKVMVWGGIFIGGKTPLYFMAKNESIDAKKYQQIIDTCLIKTGLLWDENGDERILIQDRATPPSAQSTTEFFDENDITVESLPPATPELNPIEKAWSWMKDQIAAQKPKDFVQLKECVEKAWMDLPLGIIFNYITRNTVNNNEIIQEHGANIIEKHSSRKASF